MNLSRFIIKTWYRGNVLLFNTVNGCIIKLNPFEFFLKKTKNKLKQNGFFQNDMKILADYEKVQGLRQSEILDITISFTEDCNLACKYCSQNNTKNFNKISKETINDIVEYIEICKKHYNYKKVSFHLFGGEPLLCKKEIYYLLEKLKKTNMQYSFFIDTNGVLIDKEFIKKFDNLTISITLSDEEDHNRFRIFKNGNGSYRQISDNINKIHHYLDENHKLIIRFNANHDNIKQFKDFALKLKRKKINEIIIANTYNFDFNNRTNKLSRKKYKAWYTKEALPFLLKNDFDIDFPTASYFCKGYEKHSIKIHSNGNISMCNGAKDNSKINIKEILAHFRKNGVLNLFIEEKKAELIDSKCKKCSFLLLCNGKYFCKDNYCDFTDYNLKQFLKTYVKQVEKGKQNRYN